MERFTRPGIAISLLLAVSFLSFPSSAVGRVQRSARRLRRRGDDLETFLGVDVVDRSDVPFAFDTLGHAGLWFAVTVVVLWLVSTGRPLQHPHLVRLWTSIGLVIASAFVEVAQGVFTSGRNAQWTDLAANTVGVSAGFVLMTIVAGLVLEPRRRRAAVDLAI